MAQGELTVPISDETVPLGSFLKWAQAVDSGGQAKHLVQSGSVLVNGQPETRRRRLLRDGDVVSLRDGRRLRVKARAEPEP